LKNARGILAWMPWGFMGAMGSQGLPPFTSFPPVLFASWLTSFLIVCSFHILKNRE
jgi:hypothetical protein